MRVENGCGVSSFNRTKNHSSMNQNIRRRQSLPQLLICSPLTAYVESIRERLGDNVFIPDFDPLDGGINAEFIFLRETSPQTDLRNGGSGFISRDNNDDTAKAIFLLYAKYRLDRKRTLLWNTIPAWDNSKSISFYMSVKALKF